MFSQSTTLWENAQLDANADSPSSSFLVFPATDSSANMIMTKTAELCVGRLPLTVLLTQMKGHSCDNLCEIVYIDKKHLVVSHVISMIVSLMKTKMDNEKASINPVRFFTQVKHVLKAAAVQVAPMLSCADVEKGKPVAKTSLSEFNNISNNYHGRCVESSVNLPFCV